MKGWLSTIAAAVSGAAGRREAAMCALEASQDGWFVTGRKDKPVFRNRAYERLIGDRAPGALLRELGPDGNAESRALKDAISQRKHASADFRLTGGAAGERWIRISVSPLEGGVGQIAWCVSDVTAERAAAAQAAAVTAVLDSVPIGLFAADDGGRLLYANESLARTLGRDRDELVSGDVNFGNFPAPKSGEAANGALPTDGTPTEVALRRRDGSTLDALVSQSSGPDARSGPDGRAEHRVYGVVQDLSSGRGPRQERFPGLLEQTAIGIAVLDFEGRVVEHNSALAALLHATNGGIEGRNIVGFVREDDRTIAKEELAHATAGEPRVKPVELHLAADPERVVSVYVSRIDKLSGAEPGHILHMIDTTDQKSLERQFVQAQKMQAVGQLAGGIAHDFNNLLTAIIGFCDLLLMRHQAGDHSFSDIMQVKQNANRAANLVRQLLAFSRQQTLKPEVLSLTDVLTELSNLLRRLIGETIELKMTHGRDVASVKADQGQLEQVIINLAVNARDAMPEGGSLNIRTSKVSRADVSGAAAELLGDGDYVLIEVIDTGTGIPEDQLGKIFEPFYTTKDVGAGTGLGLSTAYGIVKQFDGYIFVDSEIGRGTTFSIYLPLHVTVEAVESAAERAGDQRLTKDLTGRETILLVEDEDAVRTFGARALRNKGYTVLEADCGESALEVIASADKAIDLLITDVVMPRMDGPTLTKHVRAERPDLKVIYISGYAEDDFRASVDETVNFLPKPFSLGQLATKVKEVITADGA